MVVKVYVASDHAGVEEKKQVIGIVNEIEGFEAVDMGPDGSDPGDDYPDFAKIVCAAVLKDKGAFGVLICGSGTGMAIAANKVKGIRAALGVDEYSGKMARYDNDANVLTLRGREFDHSKYKEIVEAFLKTAFSGEERHIRRISKLE